ncbi:hypothetical protein BDP81DRAFT_183658 [Colletotrichum phormii]|uniref:Uncharacterized protein n=1 Tax=Colletotrichum phormii TaxID=359342 RepID=A0AAI9ZXP3_9PEZI|nr:uncharacterized protein BDP81DRAFT_183658 [Colletotrichum phormii]KAK1639786.1 hypothetical protein BDP81DRAFT_183658 [Colletotrichum phormii]
MFSQARWGLGAATHASATVLKKKRLLSKSGVCLEENLKGTAFCVGSAVVNGVGQGIPCQPCSRVETPVLASCGTLRAWRIRSVRSTGRQEFSALAPSSRTMKNRHRRLMVDWLAGGKPQTDRLGQPAVSYQPRLCLFPLSRRVKKRSGSVRCLSRICRR